MASSKKGRVYGPKSPEQRWVCGHCGKDFAAGTLTRHEKANGLPITFPKVTSQCHRESCSNTFEHAPSAKRKYCSKSCLATDQEAWRNSQSPVARKKISAAQKKRFKRDPRSNPFFGRTPTNFEGRGYGGFCEELGFSVRSTWERDYLIALKNAGVGFVYEPHRYDLGDCTYLPDIQVENTSFFVEITGWDKPGKAEKRKKFVEQYEVELLVVTEKPGDESIAKLIAACKEVMPL